VGTYYGLGWHDGPGYTGRNWVRLRDEGTDGCWWEIDLDGYGYSTTNGYYANGAVMDRSVTLVEENVDGPYWDRHQVRDGTYFDPDGNVVSEVRAGTGRQTWFYANGGKHWEVELRDGQRVEHAMHWPNGHLMNTHGYDGNERPHGDYTSDYEDGTPRTRGPYEHGKHVGLWYHFYPDGSVEKIEDYRTDPSTTTHFEPGERQLRDDELADS
jgi:antitoxin component YwqK of YwqJK toxin-antitoxin module